MSRLLESSALRGIEDATGRALESDEGAFSPADLTDLSLWYDPSDVSTLTTSGSNVTAMTSVGGRGPTLTPQSSAPTVASTNDLTTIAFNHAADQKLRGVLAINVTATSWTWFQVYQLTDEVTYQRGFSLQGGLNSADHDNLNSIAFNAPVSGFAPRIDRNSAFVAPGTKYVTTWRVCVATCNAGATTIYVDGVSVATGTLSSTALNAARVGYGGQGGDDVGDTWHGQLSETGFYTRVLTSGELAELTDYLIGKWLPVPTLPAAPTGLTPLPLDAKVNLSWTAPTDTGNVPLTDYDVQYREGLGAWEPFPHTPSTATVASVTGLENGVDYDFKTAAVNPVGTGPFTPSVTATPAPPSGALHLQMKGWSGNGGAIPSVILGTLTAGSTLYCGTSCYDRTITTPTDSGGHTWTQAFNISNGSFTLALWSAPNDSTDAGIAVRTGLPDESNYYAYFVSEEIGELLDWGAEVADDGFGYTVDTVADGLAFAWIFTTAPTSGLEVTTPPQSDHHDNGLPDGGGTFTAWSFGHQATTDTAGITMAVTKADWFGPYYMSVLVTLSP